LPVHGNSVQRVLQGLPGASIDHARLRDNQLTIRFRWGGRYTFTPVLSWLM
jgi:hypothetical protein